MNEDQKNQGASARNAPLGGDGSTNSTAAANQAAAFGVGDNGSQLQADLEAANQKIAELTETAKRALADLQNYRKRTEEERASFVAFANLSLLLELLGVLDNFHRAFAAVPPEVAATDWFKGARQIEQQFTGLMKKQGVSEMPSAVGQKVDTRIHEPVATGPGAKETVIEEFSKGYMLGEKVVRPAKVKVGDGSN